MGRWDPDDARAPESAPERSSDRSDSARHARDVRITELPDRVASRTRDDPSDGRHHHLTLPRGQERELVRDQGREFQLRGSEVDLLERAGQFRVTFTDDLKHDSGNPQFDADLRSLKGQGLIAERTVTHLREGRSADVVSVTPAGRCVLDAHRDPDHDHGQVYYGGWVKPNEVWHDASLLRMVREVETELADQGAVVQRIVLDDELKAEAFRALHEARSAGQSDHEAHRTAADACDLHLDGDQFVFPDVRLEVEDRDGTERTVDLELVTKEYHRGHLSGKAAAGFRMFGGSKGGGRGGTPQDPHHIGRLLR